MLSTACHTNDPNDTRKWKWDAANVCVGQWQATHFVPSCYTPCLASFLHSALFSFVATVSTCREKYCSAVRLYVPLHLDAVRGPYHPYEPWILWKQTTAGNKSFLDVEKSTLYSRICKEKKKEERIRSIYQKLGKPTHSLSVVIWLKVSNAYFNLLNILLKDLAETFLCKI